MRLTNLKQAVFEANLALVKEGLVKLTWGNVSGIDRVKGLVVIKPSGISYDEMTPEDMVVLDMQGNVVDSRLKPSSDAPTHLFLYQAFPAIGSIVHTHSEWATSWAQACRSIPCLGTTHADHFYGPVPCTRLLTPAEIQGQYERATGQVIRENFNGIDPIEVPGVLVAEHGPFCWGKTVAEAVKHAIILEEIAKLAFRTVMLGKDNPVQPAILEKHYQRKHGPDAYYGQKNGDN
ncbi:MAG: L-ribulose-5-phosphate 4-epimerase [Bacteroidia bacterium]|nr:L-ribulose-5-phosphate 4-epimerase [Bacteroidia bacterium]